MPYKRRTFKKRRTFRKKGMPLNVKQKRQVRTIVKRLNPPELKYTVGYFNQGVTNVASINTLVNWPAQGIEGYSSEQLLTNATGAGRIGNMIAVKNIQWRFKISIGDNINYVRVILFQFMDTNVLVTPIAGDVICDPTNSGHLQPINPLTKGKIKVMYDKLFHLQSGGLETIVKKLNIKPKLSNLKFTSNVTNGFGAELIKGNLYYLLISDSGAIPHPFFENTVRLCFTDA